MDQEKLELIKFFATHALKVYIREYLDQNNEYTIVTDIYKCSLLGTDIEIYYGIVYGANISNINEGYIRIRVTNDYSYCRDLNNIERDILMDDDDDFDDEEEDSDSDDFDDEEEDSDSDDFDEEEEIINTIPAQVYYKLKKSIVASCA
jgi:hypothetical protein